MPRHIPQETVESIVRDLQDMISTNYSIAKTYGVTQNYVSLVAKRNGILIKKGKRSRGQQQKYKSLPITDRPIEERINEWKSNERMPWPEPETRRLSLQSPLSDLT